MERSRYGHENEIVPGRVDGYQGPPGSYERAEYLINGFSTYMIRVPEKDLFVAVLSNDPAAQPGPGPLAFEALALGGGGSGWKEEECS